MHGRIRSNTTEWLFLNFYSGECELAILKLQLADNHENRFYYFKHILRVILSWN